MSDISAPPPAEQAPVATTDQEPVDAAPEIDPALLALFESFRPLLTEFTKVAITEAQASMVIPTVRTGTVQLINHDTGSADVLVDGDSAAIPITVVCEYPIPGDRVRCTFWPGGAAFVDGILGGQGVPPAFVMAYVGTVDGDTSSSTGLGPPRGFAWARGQTMAQNAAPGLYRRVGTRFNTGGEAATDFRLPDMRGRIVLGLDNMGGSDAGRLSVSNTLGGTGGAESVTLTTSNLPNHSHTFSASLTGASVSGSVSISGSTSVENNAHTHSMGGYAIAAILGTGDNAANVPNGNAMNPTAGTSTGGESANHAHTFSGSGSISGGSVTGGSVSGTTGATGSTSGFSILPPYMLVHWLVKL